jgi:hypothetical protein
MQTHKCSVQLASNERTLLALYEKIRLLEPVEKKACIWKVDCDNPNYTHENDKRKDMRFNVVQITDSSNLVDILWGSNTGQMTLDGTYDFECIWQNAACKCYAMASNDIPMLQQLRELYHFPILDGTRLHGDCIVFCVE